MLCGDQRRHGHRMRYALRPPLGQEPGPLAAVAGPARGNEVVFGFMTATSQGPHVIDAGSRGPAIDAGARTDHVEIDGHGDRAGYLGGPPAGAPGVGVT